LIPKPEFLVADEPVSALDVSIQAQIIKLLSELKEKLNLTILFISHDLGVVKYISDRVAVMYLGNIVEIGSATELFSEAKHPYTKALISAVPSVTAGLRRDIIRLDGDIPSPKNPPCACKFHTRCPEVMDICTKVEPENYEFSPTHFAKCHLYA
jgi:oligopeptide/dipeptide ABC transporter ATP-binding protein